MKNIAIISSGFLPVPATKGGAVENLLQSIINYNEDETNNISFTIFSILEKDAKEKSNNYKKTNFIFIKNPKGIEIFDRIIFFIAKNILKKENSQSYRFILQRLWYLNQVSKKIKKNNYDIIVLENHPTQYLALKWRKNYLKYKDKYYYHCHNELTGTYGCKELLQNTKKIICVSNYIKTSLINNYNIAPERCVIVKNGIDLKIFSKQISTEEEKEFRKNNNIKENDIIIIFSGRIVPEKGAKELILAVNKLKVKDYKLLIVGAPLNEIKTKTKYQLEIEELSKNNRNIIFTGFIPYSIIPQYYSCADIAVLPATWEEPASLTNVEAMSCGLPVITTNSGGIPEYVNEKCAILLEKNEELVDNLAEELEKLIKDKEKRIVMGKTSLKKAKEFSDKIFYNNFIKEMKL